MINPLIIVWHCRSCRTAANFTSTPPEDQPRDQQRMELAESDPPEDGSAQPCQTAAEDEEAPLAEPVQHGRKQPRQAATHQPTQRGRTQPRRAATRSPELAEPPQRGRKTSCQAEPAAEPLGQKRPRRAAAFAARQADSVSEDSNGKAQGSATSESQPAAVTPVRVIHRADLYTSAVRAPLSEKAQNETSRKREQQKKFKKRRVQRAPQRR